MKIVQKMRVFHGIAPRNPAGGGWVPAPAFGEFTKARAGGESSSGRIRWSLARRSLYFFAFIAANLVRSFQAGGFPLSDCGFSSRTIGLDDRGRTKKPKADTLSLLRRGSDTTCRRSGGRSAPFPPQWTRPSGRRSARRPRSFHSPRRYDHNRRLPRRLGPPSSDPNPGFHLDPRKAPPQIHPRPTGAPSSGIYLDKGGSRSPKRPPSPENVAAGWRKGRRREEGVTSLFMEGSQPSLSIEGSACDSIAEVSLQTVRPPLGVFAKTWRMSILSSISSCLWRIDPQSHLILKDEKPMGPMNSFRSGC